MLKNKCYDLLNSYLKKNKKSFLWISMAAMVPVVLGFLLVTTVAYTQELPVAERGIIERAGMEVTGTEKVGIETENKENNSHWIMQEQNPGQVLRVHIRAHDDTPEEQALKYQLKDEFLDLTSPYSQYDSYRELIHTLQHDLPHIEDQLNARMKQLPHGERRKATVNLTVKEFPLRHYGNHIFPPGEYHAVVVEIGRGEGQNWWCLLYPSLCFPPSETGKNMEETEEKRESEETEKIEETGETGETGEANGTGRTEKTAETGEAGTIVESKDADKARTAEESEGAEEEVVDALAIPGGPESGGGEETHDLRDEPVIKYEPEQKEETKWKIMIWKWAKNLFEKE